MKALLTVSLLMIFGCATKIPNELEQIGTDIIDQEAVVEIQVVSRGKYQYLLSIESGEHKGKYLPEQLGETFCEDALKVKFRAKLLQKTGTVYKPGATDIPEADYRLPIIKILSIEKL